MLDPGLTQLMKSHIRERSRPLEPIPTGESLWSNQFAGIRCVAFDIYGTLLVSAAGDVGTSDNATQKSDPFASVAPLLGIPSHQAPALADTYYQTIHGYHHRGRQRGIQYPEVDIRSVWSDVIAAWSGSQRHTPEEIALAYELAANPVWPMPGARSILESLHHRGIRLAIVSNAQFYTPLILEVLLDRPLDSLHLYPRIWSFEIGAAKPSPIPFRSLKDTLSHEGIDAGETLYVGNDMLNDVVTAQDEGFRAILFAGDARSLRLRRDRPEIRSRTPDGVMTDLMHLTSVIDVQ